ncbi:MAG: hypothetical protein K0B11_03990 [Mariniphaga sp.]|nr:hypothetical protein [Mariniphaga sp.]
MRFNSLTPVDDEDIYFTPAMIDKIDGAIKQVQFFYEFTKPIQVLLNASKVFKNPGTKKEVEI